MSPRNRSLLLFAGITTLVTLAGLVASRSWQMPEGPGYGWPLAAWYPSFGGRVRSWHLVLRHQFLDPPVLDLQVLLINVDVAACLAAAVVGGLWWWRGNHRTGAIWWTGAACGLTLPVLAFMELLRPPAAPAASNVPRPQPQQRATPAQPVAPRVASKVPLAADRRAPPPLPDCPDLEKAHTLGRGALRALTKEDDHALQGGALGRFMSVKGIGGIGEENWQTRLVLGAQGALAILPWHPPENAYGCGGVRARVKTCRVLEENEFSQREACTLTLQWPGGHTVSWRVEVESGD